MRVHAPRQADHVATSPPTRRGSGSVFSVAPDQAPRAAAAATAPRAAAGIEALIALQAVDAVGERRGRAVRRGRSALDALDALKVGLLAGQLDAGALTRLKTSTGELAEPSGDARLDGILREIELRAAVELAKVDAARPG